VVKVERKGADGKFRAESQTQLMVGWESCDQVSLLRDVESQNFCGALLRIAQRRLPKLIPSTCKGRRARDTAVENSYEQDNAGLITRPEDRLA